MPKFDRPEFAVTSERQLTLRHIFIDVYLEDKDFCTELIELADGFNGPATDDSLPWWFVKQQALQWTLRVSQLCEKWGLTFADKAAEQAVHWWCTERRRVGDQCKPGNLVSGFHAGSNLPLDDIAPPPAVCWNTTLEGRAEARKRILAAWEKHLDAELGRILQAHEGVSATVLRRRPQRRSAAHKHLRWLFLRQAKHLSYAAIARDERMTEADAVRKACPRLAGEIGLIMRSK